MIVIIIVIILIIFLVGLLFLPISIVADTDRKMYYISIPFYFKAYVTESYKIWKFRMRIFQIPFSIKYPTKKKTSIQTADLMEKKTRKKKRKLNINIVPSIIIKTIKSLRIKQLRATIDTGDFPLNAQLIPVVMKLNGENISIRINFENTNSLYLRVVTRLYKLTWIIIRYIIF